MNNRLPGNSDAQEILDSINSDNLDIALVSGTVTLRINAGNKKSKLHILDGKILLAAPVITKEKITAWHLSGELADRLKINY